MKRPVSPLPSTLQFLFAPSVAVMNRLSYARKFILICVLVSGPLAVLAGLQFSTATGHIEFDTRERFGISYTEPAWDMLLAVQRHRVLSIAVLAGQGQFREHLEESASAGDRAMERMTRAEGQHGKALRTAQLFAEIRTLWSALRSQNAIAAPSTDHAHNLLANRITYLISLHIANQSNLILDPDLDSYWLMDAFMLKMPTLTNGVGEVCSAALRLPDADAGVERVWELAAGLRATVRISADLADVNLRTAVEASPRFGRSTTILPSLQPPMVALVEAIRVQAEQIKWQLSPVGDAPPSQGRDQGVMSTTLEAFDELAGLHQRLGPELDHLIGARLARHRAQRLHGLLAAGAAAAVLSYLSIGIWLSVRTSILTLSSEGFSPPSRDELGEIAVAYNRERGEKTVLQEQLVKADRLATIGHLAAGTAHELNEPLGAILGFAQLALKSAELADQTRADLTKIERAALHAREVIRKLMLFARQTPPRKIPVQLNQIVEDSLELLTVRSEKEGVVLSRDLAQNVPEIVADPAHVRQVVINLVVNAIQASTRGQRVLVTTGVVPAGVSLVVQDEGAGISGEALHNLFLPFYTTKDVGQGTGLGLSVVHGIVAAHGGNISVTTAAGGTRFEVLWKSGE